MRCSSCSEPLRPVVAIDIDGTLGDWHSHFAAFAAMWLDSPTPPDYRGAEPYRDWFTRSFGCDKTTFRAVKLAFRQGGLKRSMPVFSGARALLNDARDCGAEVWLTTSRPHDRYDRVDPDTREWLRRNLLNFDGLIYSDTKLKDLHDRVDPDRVVAVLDDLQEVLRDGQRYFPGRQILRRSLYNRDVRSGFESVLSLTEARLTITPRVIEWSNTYS